MFLKYVIPGKSRLNSSNIFKIRKGNGTRLETRLGQPIFHFFSLNPIPAGGGVNLTPPCIFFT